MHVSKKLSAIYRELFQAYLCEEDKSKLKILFQKYKELFLENRYSTGLGLSLKLLEKLFGSMGKNQIKILDHGCGGGRDIIELTILGYTKAYGVDLPAKEKRMKGFANYLLNNMLSINEARVQTYDGNILPYESESFDFAFSQGVLEHVKDDCIDCFYQESARVLKPTGIRWDSFPHIGKPYDSHSGLWFVHYLPKILRKKVYGLYNKESLVDWVHLRTAKYHKKKLKKYFGFYKDISQEVIGSFHDEQRYDGELRNLRSVISSMMRRSVAARTIFYPAVKICGSVNTLAAKSSHIIPDRLVID